MPYNFVADSFHTKKLCNRIFQAKCDFTCQTAVLRLELLFGSLGPRGNVRCSS